MARLRSWPMPSEFCGGMTQNRTGYDELTRCTCPSFSIGRFWYDLSLIGALGEPRAVFLLKMGNNVGSVFFRVKKRDSI